MDQPFDGGRWDQHLSWDNSYAEPPHSLWPLPPSSIEFSTTNFQNNLDYNHSHFEWSLYPAMPLSPSSQTGAGGTPAAPFRHRVGLSERAPLSALGTNDDFNSSWDDAPIPPRQRPSSLLFGHRWPSSGHYDDESSLELQSQGRYPRHHINANHESRHDSFEQQPTLAAPASPQEPRGIIYNLKNPPLDPPRPRLPSLPSISDSCNWLSQHLASVFSTLDPPQIDSQSSFANIAQPARAQAPSPQVNLTSQLFLPDIAQPAQAQESPAHFVHRDFPQAPAPGRTYFAPYSTPSHNNAPRTFFAPLSTPSNNEHENLDEMPVRTKRAAVPSGSRRGRSLVSDAAADDPFVDDAAADNAPVVIASSSPPPPPAFRSTISNKRPVTLTRSASGTLTRSTSGEVKKRGTKRPRDDDPFASDDLEEEDELAGLEVVDLLDENKVGAKEEEPPKKNIVRLGEYQCVICMDDCTNITVTVCGHLFCAECLHNALNVDRSKTICPICRQKLDIRPNGRKKTKQFVHLELKMKSKSSLGKKKAKEA